MKLFLVRKDRSNLPVNIFVYECTDIYKGIRFQLNRKDKASNQPFGFMSKDGKVFCAKDNQLAEEDIQRIRNFVFNNKDLLIKVASEEIDNNKFMQKMIKEN